MRNETPDFARSAYRWHEHHRRYVRHVESMPMKLGCQDCGGRGGFVDVVCDGQGPWEPCGFCEGTGLQTPYLRGLYLRWRRSPEGKRWKKRRAA